MNAKVALKWFVKAIPFLTLPPTLTPECKQLEAALLLTKKEPGATAQEIGLEWTPELANEWFQHFSPCPSCRQWWDKGGICQVCRNW